MSAEVFSILESEVVYWIVDGRVNPIWIDHGSPPLPPLPPTPNQVDYGNVVIKWIMQVSNAYHNPFPYFQLHLFEPKWPNVDPPPPPVGDPNEGWMERGPPSPQKENSPLWHYVSYYWTPVSGAAADMDIGGSLSESDATWIGPRTSHRVTFPMPDGYTDVRPVPLRVATTIEQKSKKVLLLLEIRRKQRLRLVARPIIITPIIYKGICFIATAAYGSEMAPTVQYLRDFRDNVVLKSRFREGFEKLLSFYYEFSPSIAEEMDRNEAFKNLMKYTVVWPTVRLIKTGVSVSRSVFKRQDGSN